MQMQFLVGRCNPHLRMRADAWAAGSQLGIGGWWSTKPNPEPQDCVWFSLQLQVSDFRSDWGLSQDAQKNIASFETLAQIALLFSGASELANSQGSLYVPFGSGNAPTIGVGNELFSDSPQAVVVSTLRRSIARIWSIRHMALRRCDVFSLDHPCRAGMGTKHSPLSRHVCRGSRQH